MSFDPPFFRTRYINFERSKQKRVIFYKEKSNVYFLWDLSSMYKLKGIMSFFLIYHSNNLMNWTMQLVFDVQFLTDLSGLSYIYRKADLSNSGTCYNVFLTKLVVIRSLNVLLDDFYV